MIGVYDFTVILTYISFLSGLTGIYFAISGNTFVAVICLMFSGFCDMFDGKVARLKKNRTEEEKRFGIQIDSLSDLVAFSILPSAIGYGLGVHKTTFAFSLYLLPLCGLIRLAYFNVNEEERSSKTEEVRSEYLGLPVTTTAIIVPVIYFFRKYIPSSFTYVYGSILVITAILFIKRFKMFKLKTRGMIITSLIGLVILVLLIVSHL